MSTQAASSASAASAHKGPVLGTGRVQRVSGPLVVADQMSGSGMYELVHVGEFKIVGEIIKLVNDTAFIQVYEDTSGITIGDPIERTGAPLQVELGPGIMNSIFDGIQRPLSSIADLSKSVFIPRGVQVLPLNHEKKWAYKPTPGLAVGDIVTGGSILGSVYENALMKEHRIIVPPNVAGTLLSLTPAGDYTVDEVVATLRNKKGKTVELRMFHHWPVRKPRPVAEKLPSDFPLLTGQRVLDSLFPSVLGGTCAIPGAFGCGKTCISQALSKHSNAQCIIYVGCFAKGTPVRLADGSVKAIEEIAVADMVMGPDSTPRCVDVAFSGRDAMYSVKEVSKNNAVGLREYMCNSEHLLVVETPRVVTVNEGTADASVDYFTLNKVLTADGRSIDMVSPRTESWSREVDDEAMSKAAEFAASLPRDPIAWTVQARDVEMIAKEVLDATVQFSAPLLVQKSVVATKLAELGLGDKATCVAWLMGHVAAASTSDDAEVAERLAKIAKGLNVEVADLKSTLTGFGISSESVPAFLATESFDVRESFLAGVIDSAATVATTLEGVKTATINTACAAMRDGVVALARSLGVHASVCAEAETFTIELTGASPFEAVLSKCAVAKKAAPAPATVERAAERFNFTIEKTSDDEEYFGLTLCGNSDRKYVLGNNVVVHNCGERGNEMAEVLEEFPELTTEVDGQKVSIMERTCLVANTSNMPVAAREASIYTGITLAEYFRDQGVHVAMMADSTSRWAEALREISGRLGEMPGDAGYPAYLASRLASFYERAGRVKCIGNGLEGSVTIVGAVSPPGGDFSDPVTTATLDIVQVFWGLDKKLAQKKHFPSVNWNLSFTKYERGLGAFYAKTNPEYLKNVQVFKALLGREKSLQETVQLVGKDSLGEEQKLQLDMARVVREDFLMQNAFSDWDYNCPLIKTAWMLKNIATFYELAFVALTKDQPEPRLTWDRLKKKLKNEFTALTDMKFKLPSLDPEVLNADFQALHNSIRGAFKEL